MPKGKADSKVIGILEEAVKGIIEDYHSNQVDFKVGDVVKCSLMIGIFKVYGFHDKDKVMISHIDDNGELLPITAKYLKKVDINEKSMKVLFGRS